MFARRLSPHERALPYPYMQAIFIDYIMAKL